MDAFPNDNNTWYSIQSFSTDYYLTANLANAAITAGSSGTDSAALWQIFGDHDDSPSSSLRNKAYGPEYCMVTADVPSSPVMGLCNSTSHTAWFNPYANGVNASDGNLLSITWPFYYQLLAINAASLALSVTNDTNGDDAQNVDFQWGFRSVSAIDPSWSQVSTSTSSMATSTTDSSATSRTGSSTTSTIDSTSSSDTASSFSTTMIPTSAVTTTIVESSSSLSVSSSLSTSSTSIILTVSPESSSFSTSSTTSSAILTVSTSSAIPLTTSSAVSTRSSSTSSSEPNLTSTYLVTITPSVSSKGPITSTVIVTAPSQNSPVSTRSSSSTPSVTSTSSSGAVAVSNPVKYLGKFGVLKATVLVTVGVQLVIGCL